MAGINKVILVGRLGNDPEVRYTPNGSAVVRFSVATSEEWRDKNTGEKKERTEWHRVVAWDKLGERCAEYLAKGRQVYVEGRLQTRSYEDKEGVKRYSTEIVANDVQFLGGREGQPGKADAAAVPASRGAAGAVHEPPSPTDDDIPF